MSLSIGNKRKSAISTTVPKLDHATNKKVRLGSPVIIKLNSSGTTGYNWRPDFDSSEFKFLGMQRQVMRRAMGASGHVVFKFKPLLRGDHKIRFDLIRPWEQAPRDYKEFYFTVA